MNFTWIMYQLPMSETKCYIYVMGATYLMLVLNDMERSAIKKIASLVAKKPLRVYSRKTRVCPGIGLVNNFANAFNLIRLFSKVNLHFFIFYSANILLCQIN